MMETFIVQTVFTHLGQKKSLKKPKNVCENYDYFLIKTLKENNKVLKYNHREKCIKSPLKTL